MIAPIIDPTKNTTFNSTNKNQEEEPVRESEHLWSKSSGNETASIHIPTKRLNNYKIPVYLGADPPIGSNIETPSGFIFAPGATPIPP